MTFFKWGRIFESMGFRLESEPIAPSPLLSVFLKALKAKGLNPDVREENGGIIIRATENRREVIEEAVKACGVYFLRLFLSRG